MSNFADQFMNLLCETDSVAAMEFAVKSDASVNVVADLDAAMRDSYWKKKNLAESLMIGRAALQFAVTAAAASTDEKLTADLRGKAKTLCYNIASFAWRGWDEPGITVTAADEYIGLDAARANLRLASELNRGALPTSRGHWMLGAQLISAGDYIAAQTNFKKAAELAIAAVSKMDECLSRTFGWMAMAMQDGFVEKAASGFAASVQELKSLPESESFVLQVTTALKVYIPTSPLCQLAEVASQTK